MLAISITIAAAFALGLAVPALTMHRLVATGRPSAHLYAATATVLVLTVLALELPNDVARLIALLPVTVLASLILKYDIDSRVQVLTHVLNATYPADCPERDELFKAMPELKSTDKKWYQVRNKYLLEMRAWIIISIMIAVWFAGLPPDLAGRYLPYFVGTLAGTIVSTLATWIKRRYKTLQYMLRQHLTLNQKDAFFGAEYAAFVGLIGASIGLGCLIFSTFNIGDYGNAQGLLWATPIAWLMPAIVATLVFTLIAQKRLIRHIAPIIFVALGVAGSILMISRTPAPWTSLIYTILVLATAFLSIYYTNFRLQVRKAGGEIIATTAFLLPVGVLLWFYVATMDHNRGSRPNLTEQFTYLAGVFALYLLGTMLTTWVDWGTRTPITEQSPLFNSAHNAILLAACVAIGLAVSLQLLPPARAEDYIVSRWETAWPSLFATVVIGWFSIRNWKAHKGSGAHNARELGRHPEALRKQWHRSMAQWRVIQPILLLAGLALLPWGYYVTEAL